MYEDFFHFREKPFALEPSARFIVLSSDHREALATLVYAIDEQEGWAMLLGQPGVGKTTLVIALLKDLGERVIPAVITNPRVEPLDFMNMMALELGLPGPFRSKGQFLVALNDLLKQCRREGKVILLVVDEAHSLLPEMVEELRLLGNLDDSSPRVLNIFLVGQPELLKLIKQSGGTSLLQRLRRYYLLRPMGEQETTRYIEHRLKIAGGNPDLFTAQAMSAIHRLTRGVPRLINSLCDDALLLAYTQDMAKVDLAQVVAAAKEDPSLRWTFGALDLPEEAPAEEPAAPEPGAEPGQEQAPWQDTPIQAPPEPGQYQAPVQQPQQPGAPAQAAQPQAYQAPQQQPVYQTPPPQQPQAQPQAYQAPPQPQAYQVPPQQQPQAYQAPPGPAPVDKARRQAELKAQRQALKAQKQAQREAVKAEKKAQAAAMRELKGPGFFSRIIGRLSREAPHSFWMRLAVLVGILLLVFLLYQGWQHGGRSLAVRMGLISPAIMMPGDINSPLPRNPARPRQEGPPDWGPLLRPGQSTAPRTGSLVGGGV
ncbi:MAG: AAA family ATPase [Desulfarculaceae bacterium]|nr:AAA family ATPase [Desulfarculaceae bacterium]MCF8046005.1 AAA family ATPase [Desulfarculaceae bacterium]MCF8064942.1 AAA family ATPase [Desulfarculaceae bacterium]MCF8097668.1 AAA family ATPase [Desulfarculaceae bacterium]MCF8123071.1 AAA family ATPase [Desulfarculaceae bacterium]